MVERNDGESFTEGQTHAVRRASRRRRDVIWSIFEAVLHLPLVAALAISLFGPQTSAYAVAPQIPTAGRVVIFVAITVTSAGFYVRNVSQLLARFHQSDVHEDEHETLQRSFAEIVRHLEDPD